MPGSKTTQGRPGTRFIAPVVLPSAKSDSVGTLNCRVLSRLDGWPAGPPVKASSRTSRCATHDSGPFWFAIPFLSETFTLYSLSISQRTSVRFFPFRERTPNSCAHFFTRATEGKRVQF